MLGLVHGKTSEEGKGTGSVGQGKQKGKHHRFSNYGFKKADSSEKLFKLSSSFYSLIPCQSRFSTTLFRSLLD